MAGITLERSGGLGVITIDRPAKLNALDLSMYDELGEAFAQLGADPGIAAGVLTGAGDRAFCVGADLSESIPALASSEFDISHWDTAHQKHSTMDKPIVAAINGLCLGGGFEIMLSTDIRIAADSATFGLPETGVGVVPAGGTLVRLIRQIPYAFAMDLMLRGEHIDAATAQNYGLVNRVVPQAEVLNTAMHTAEQLAARSWTALATVKKAVRQLADLPYDEAFRHEALLGQEAFTSADSHEGLEAFAGRREAKFPSHRASANGRPMPRR